MKLDLNFRIDFRNLKKLSVICFTKDRPRHFVKVYAYWRQYPVEFIVADGSETTLTEQSISTEFESVQSHPSFVLKFCRDPNFPSRFEWISKQVSREFVIFNNDDDFVYASNVEKAIDVLIEDSNLAGIYSWRNFSSRYVSKKVNVYVADALMQKNDDSRLKSLLDQNRNLPDAIWLSVLRSNNVKTALHVAYLAAKVGFKNDRLSLNALSVAFVMSNLMSGNFAKTEMCLFFKRSFEVESDVTLASPKEIGPQLEVRAENLRETTYKALQTSFINERGIEEWKEVEIGVREIVWECSAFEFHTQNRGRISWRRVRGKIRKELQDALSILAKNRNSNNLVYSKPSLSNLFLCRWFRWNFWLIIHNEPCCRAAYDFLREVNED